MFETAVLLLLPVVYVFIGVFVAAFTVGAIGEYDPFWLFCFFWPIVLLVISGIFVVRLVAELCHFLRLSWLLEFVRKCLNVYDLGKLFGGWVVREPGKLFKREVSHE